MESKLEQLIEDKNNCNFGKLQISKFENYIVLYWDVMDGMKDVCIVYDNTSGELYPNLGDKNNIIIDLPDLGKVEFAIDYWYQLK